MRYFFSTVEMWLSAQGFIFCADTLFLVKSILYKVRRMQNVSSRMFYTWLDTELLKKIKS